MTWLEATRPTALPAIIYAGWWPVFALLRARHALAFFIATGVASLLLVAGPWLTVGLVVAIVAGYGLIELVMRLERGRGVAFGVLLAIIHTAYWAAFHLPLPEVFVLAPLRDADRAPAFVLFSGIGVSFFRLMSYACDRYRGEIAAPRFGHFLGYMLFFPQFRHGPVERYGHLTPQLAAARAVARWSDLGVGLLRIGAAVGTLYALVFGAVALSRLVGMQFDNLGLGVLSDPSGLSAGQVVLLVHTPVLLLYILESSFARLQLGVGRCFGVRGTENFAYPFMARTPAEVWHRWNITVSAWLRDYAYIPLGGNRRTKYANIVIVFVYCGLLHALQWRCLAWGLWTGGTLALFIWIQDQWQRRQRDTTTPRWRRRIIDWTGRVLTFEWLCIGVTIILDPHGCGVPLLGRYVSVLLGRG
jgi:alginate O-acetyltransferase complex protein AlgI